MVLSCCRVGFRLVRPGRAGSRGFTAIGEWVLDASPQVWAAFGVRRDPLSRRYEPPDEATIRRVLEEVDGDALDAAIGSWLAGALAAGRQRVRPAAGVGHRRRALSVDGKALRGTRHHTIDGQSLHLLSVLEHADFLVTQKNAHYILVAGEEPAKPVLPAQRPALAEDSHHVRLERPRSRTRRTPHHQDRHARRRTAVPARGPGHPHHPPDTQDRYQQMEDHHRLRGHQPRHPPGHTRPDRRLDPRPLEHRSTPPRPRRHLRRRRLTGQNPQQPPRNGRPQKPGDRSLETNRPRQHRRRPTPPQPRRHTHPDHPGHHPHMTETDTTRLCWGPGADSTTST
jgi:hypothetical protein